MMIMVTMVVMIMMIDGGGGGGDDHHHHDDEDNNMLTSSHINLEYHHGHRQNWKVFKRTTGTKLRKYLRYHPHQTTHTHTHTHRNQGHNDPADIFNAHQCPHSVNISSSIMVFQNLKTSVYS
jgi:hypothetical protein